jgi:ribose/xylose/arabinose/galactoside ABC-type transport system permease subunit
MNHRRLGIPKLELLSFLISTAVFFRLTSPYFLEWENILNIFIQSSVLLTAAVGMTLVIGTAGIDLSIGANLALSGIVTAWFLKSGSGVFPAVVVGLCCGSGLGVVNGFLTARLHISPFIITLGTAGVYRALALILTEAQPIYGLPWAFRRLGVGNWGPLPLPVLISCLLVLLGYFLVRWTPFGVNLRAVGDNLEGAFRMGVPVKTTLIGVYGLCGLTSALSGMIALARLNTAEAIAGLGLELEAIAAVVIGGTSFFGGEASLLGTFLGALIMGTLANGLTIINVPSYYQQLVIGVVFILAVWADSLRRNREIHIPFRSEKENPRKRRKDE